MKEKEQLRLLAAVVRDSGDTFVLQDLDGKILAWNRAPTGCTAGVRPKPWAGEGNNNEKGR